MANALLSRRLVWVAVLGLAGGCAATDDTTSPPPPPPPPPPAPAFALWSDPNTWPNHSVPAAGAAVVVPAGQTVRLDVNPSALRSLTIDGTLEIADQPVALTSDWIVVHGTLRIGTEQQAYTKKAVITLTGPSSDAIEGAGGKVLAIIGGTLELHGRSRTSWTKLNATAAAGGKQLVVNGPVDWEAGDRLVVASTDFDPMQAEELMVTGVSGTQVTVQNALRYTHWGTVQTFAGKPVDERAEIGLLTRSIVIQGDSSSLGSGFGGHLMVMQGGVAHVDGVEFTRMGQKKQLARYPMHWHLAGNVEGQYFRNNAVWKTFNRCLTIHGTSNLKVSGNVCYDNIGHAYFLEDGAETGNVLDHNLGLVTRRPANGEALLPSDVDPATYWITNPDNTYRGNVAAGSRGFGFWIALPAAPTGLSTGNPAKPRETPFREFTDNVAHSNNNTGLNLDHGPKPDGTTETVHYAPRQIPGDNNSPIVVTNFRNFTGYKHSFRAVWLRGSELRLVGATLADNHIGGTFASNETFIQDGLVVGPTANSATAFARGFPVRGYEFYDGRVGAERVTFVNFQPTANNYMSALGYNRTNGFPISTGNYAKQLTFVNSNELFLENPDPTKDGDKAAVAYDVDGSLTGTAGQYVASHDPLLTTTGCTFKTAWNAYVCSKRFVNLQVRSANTSTAVAPLNLVRDDGAQTNFVGVPDNNYVVSASVFPARQYSVDFQAGIPEAPQVFAHGLQATDWVRVSFSFPTGSVNVYRDYNRSASIGSVASMAELDASTGDKFYYDSGAHVLHLKVAPQSGRDWATLFVVKR